MVDPKNVPPKKETGIHIPSLYAELQQIPGPRQASGKRHPLAAMLGAACVAMLCGYRSSMLSRAGSPTMEAPIYSALALRARRHPPK